MAATVPAETIERGGSVEYQARLRRASERAEAQRGARPTRLPLFTADDLAAIKPRLTVRSAAAFRNRTLQWGALYVLAIWGVALVWWLKISTGVFRWRANSRSNQRSWASPTMPT